jgi:DNA-binding transcriptional regulator GbsR (MarR family)
LSDDSGAFLDEFATLLAGWNMPNNAARVYGYLLLQSEPASLDEIAAQLEISKSNACTAAKVLESAGHCRRVAERGPSASSTSPARTSARRSLYGQLRSAR